MAEKTLDEIKAAIESIKGDIAKFQENLDVDIDAQAQALDDLDDAVTSLDGATDNIDDAKKKLES